MLSQAQPSSHRHKTLPETISPAGVRSVSTKSLPSGNESRGEPERQGCTSLLRGSPIDAPIGDRLLGGPNGVAGPGVESGATTGHLPLQVAHALCSSAPAKGPFGLQCPHQ